MAVRSRLVRLSDATILTEETDTPRLTVPMKLPWLVKVMVELPGVPEMKSRLAGLAVILKSST